jgi:hypothetical protein
MYKESFEKLKKFLLDTDGISYDEYLEIMKLTREMVEK